jgi:putrescine transport system substrate-binding protein
VALHYVGKPAYSENPEDFKAAGEMLAKVRRTSACSPAP